MIYKELAENPLKTREDVQKAAWDLIRPVIPFFEEDGSGFRLDSTAAHYKDRTIYLEGYARLLLALAPLMKSGFRDEKVERLLISGLTNGTDPAHPNYWGDPGKDYQLLISMTGVALAILIAPERMWAPLSAKARHDAQNWLGATNTNVILPNNQIFFRIIVNTCLRFLGSEHYRDESMKDCFALVDRMYLGDGLYTDGVDKGPVDYYNSWVMHWGALIFCGYCGDAYPDVAEEYRKRAGVFAGHFKYWFAGTGESVPFGRSLTYRAAQLAMLAASVSAGHESLPWGEIKGLILRNLRWWFQQPFFSETGVPKIGYAYPNLKMSEQYNSPNSPLYMLNPFLILDSEADHPFWKAEEAPLRKEKESYVLKQAGLLFHERPDSGHLTLLNSGQRYSGYHCLHLEEKYEKFAYSSYFGFNVTTGTNMLDRTAADNMLLLSEDAIYWRHKRMTLEWRAEEDYLFCRWQPFDDVEVRTWILPCFPWHVRIHKINSGRKLFSAEGGFCLPREDALYDCYKDVSETGEGVAAIGWRTGFTGLCDPLGKTAGEVIVSMPNANLLHTNVYIPVLRGEWPAGESTLVAAVLAHPDEPAGRAFWKKRLTKAKLKEIIPLKLRETLGSFL